MGAIVSKFWGLAKADGNDEGLALKYCEKLCQLCWSNFAGCWYQGHIIKRRISILDIEGVWRRTTTLGSIHKAIGWAIFFLFFLPYMRIIGGLYLVSTPGWRRVKMLRIMLFGGACDKYICVEWPLDNFDLGFKPRPNKVA